MRGYWYTNLMLPYPTWQWIPDTTTWRKFEGGENGTFYRWHDRNNKVYYEIGVGAGHDNWYLAPPTAPVVYKGKKNVQN